MSGFNRFQPRTDTYANWETVNNNTPGGLRILQGEICVIIADPASAAAGLSNILADTTQPKNLRLANTGEVLGFKMGEGAAQRWDEMPIMFHLPNINFGNGSGRILGTRQNGATHVYNHPGKALRAIFAPVYSAPDLGVSLTSNGNSINGALFEVGQSIPGAAVNVQPYLHSYRIKLGQAYEVTSGRTQLGLDETAGDPNTIAAFSRALAGFSLTPGTAQYDGGSGTFRRNFLAAVTDTRPSNEGGEVRTESGVLEVRAAYPAFFGKSAATMPTDPAQLGAFIQANGTPMLRYRGRYDAGKVAYRNGERPLFFYPAAWGSLSQILDELGLNQLGYGGAAFNAPVNAVLSKAGQYDNVPYLGYATDSGFNADILFSFLF